MGRLPRSFVNILSRLITRRLSAANLSWKQRKGNEAWRRCKGSTENLMLMVGTPANVPKILGSTRNFLVTLANTTQDSVPVVFGKQPFGAVFWLHNRFYLVPIRGRNEEVAPIIRPIDGFFSWRITREDARLTLRLLRNRASYILHGRHNYIT